MSRGEHRDQAKNRFKNVTYRTYMIVAFALVAALTAGIIILVVSSVFNVYFTSYTTKNMEAVTEFIAIRIGEEAKEAGSLKDIDFGDLTTALRLTPEAEIVVTDDRGQTVFTTTEDSMDESTHSLKVPLKVANYAITVDDKKIGSVKLWIHGSDAFMSQIDKEFRSRTFESLMYSGLVAIVIATLIGLLFSRSLSAPVKQITETAKKIRDGDLTARTGMEGGNEIETLGETFDAMAASIEKDRQLEKRLTSDVAHELRTPLMAIQATVEAMMDGVYEADTEHLALVDSEVRRLSRLVDALLKLSRLEMRSQPLNEQVNDIGDMVKTIVASHEMFVEDSGLHIQAHVKGKVLAYCDMDMIRQAIANLVSNAVRYTEEGGRIDLYVYEKDDMAVIDVTDTGIGLTPEEEKMVFSRFWRADEGRKKESGGLGVGLAVVKEIVSRHNGKVDVHGEKGVGSTFTIMIPAYKE